VLVCIVVVPGTDDKPYDGFTRHIYEISRRLPNFGFKVVNLVPSLDGSSGVRCIGGSYWLYKTPVPDFGSVSLPSEKLDSDLKAVKYYMGYRGVARKILRSISEPLVLHTHGFYTIAQPTRKQTYVRRIATFHGFGQLDAIIKYQSLFRAKILNWVLKKVYGNADLYTAFSKTMKTIATKLYSIEPKDISVVPHGFDAQFFSSKASLEEISKIETRFNLD
jgi:glycosyltransferase involved in cell wall biosynthesis